MATSEHTEWDASAFILRGEHCPRDLVRATLDTIRNVLDASSLIHLAFDEEAIIGGLSFATGFPNATPMMLGDLLNHADLASSRADISRLCVDAAKTLYGNMISLEPEYVKDLVKGITELKYRKYRLLKDEREHLLDVLQHGIFLDNTGQAGSTLGAGDIRSIIIFDGPGHSHALLGRSGHLNTLAVRLKSTPEAAAHRDASVMKQVGNQLATSQTSDEAPQRFGEFAQAALQLAVDVTRSEAGAIYFLSRDSLHHFALVAQFGRWRLPKSLAREKSGPVQSVVSNGNAMQRNKWWPGALKSGDDPPPTGNVLLSPIGGPAGDPWGHAVGALILFRRHEKDFFGAYDLALARNVSLRIALTRTANAMSRIGAIITTLRTEAFRLGVQEGPSSVSRSPGDPAQVPIPRDVSNAVPLIQPALRELARLTDSHSATLRIALPFPLATESHGLALVRVASWPEATPKDDPSAILTQDLGGYNWASFLEGKALYKDNVSGKSDYFEVRPSTVAELSYPVRVEGTVVGTINLESPLRQSYSFLQPLVGAFSGAVGRTLADARAALEQETIYRAARALNHRHTMESQVDGLKKIVEAADIDSLSATSLAEGLVKIGAELDAMRELQADHVGTDGTLPAILTRAARAVGYLGDLPEIPEDPLFTTLFANGRGQPLGVCFTNILSNLINYTAPTLQDADGLPLRSISYDTACFQGRNHLVVIFDNYADSYLDSANVANLYRCQITNSEGRLRVGGFLAGLNARRVDARIHAFVQAGGRRMRTTLVVPVRGTLRW